MIAELHQRDRGRGFDHTETFERLSNVRRIHVRPTPEGHYRLSIDTPSSHRGTSIGLDDCLVRELELFDDEVHDARGSSVCGPDEVWLKTVIDRDLDARLDEFVRSNVEYLNNSEVVAAALEEFLERRAGEEFQFVEDPESTDDDIAAAIGGDD